MKNRIPLLLLMLTIGLSPLVYGQENPKVTELLKAMDQKVMAGDLDGALVAANEAVKVDAKDARGIYTRGRIYEQKKEFEKALADYAVAVKIEPRLAPLYQRSGEIHFRLGNFKESVASFDKYLERFPAQTPHHWQRGISHYYAGMYAEGVKQFADHRTVNGNDVENSVFHYICLVKAKDKATALKEFIPTGGDSRVPMMQIHALYSGKGSIEEILKACQVGNPGPDELKNRLFYAHLYIGLWYESEGKAKEAREHIFKAAGEYGVEGYMGDVARVHAAVFKKQEKK
jgi:lipoprotein NlpI